jgi:hypothetical protein
MIFDRRARITRGYLTTKNGISMSSEREDEE